MIQDIYPAQFDLSYKTRDINADDTLVLIRDRGVCLKDGRLPLRKEISGLENEEFYYLFSIDDTSYFTSTIIHDEVEYLPIRKSFSDLNNRDAFAISTGTHLANWYQKNRYCGRCGQQLMRHDQERAMYCPHCHNMIYPMIAPAVIIGLIAGDKILVSRYANRDYKGIALLAGFCEIGETPEETCRREVFEEVGLHINNIRYFGSQPWGIDSNLLLGYFVQLDGESQICLDRNELASAEWLTREELPERADLKSLTATMIEAFRKNEI